MEKCGNIIKHWQKFMPQNAQRAQDESAVDEEEMDVGQKLWASVRHHVADGSFSKLAQQNNVFEKAAWQLPHASRWWGTVALGSHRQSLREKQSKELDLDPSVVRGSYPNKLRLFVRPNTRPQNRVLVSLVIGVGSLAEAPEERGYAHLIEHLAFRNTQSFPNDKIHTFLRSIGASIGADTNAETSFAHTSFDFSIPYTTSDEMMARLTIVMDFLRDVCSGIVITEETLAAERRIVLEEYRKYQKSGTKNETDSFMFALEGYPHAHRTPIGTIETLQSATVASVKAFYDKWYQPQFTTVVIAGDCGPVDGMIELVQEKFVSWEPTNESAQFNLTSALPDTTLSATPRMQCQAVDDPDVSACRIAFVINHNPAHWQTEVPFEMQQQIAMLSLILDDHLMHIRSQAQVGLIRFAIDEVPLPAVWMVQCVLVCRSGSIPDVLSELWQRLRYMRECPLPAAQLSFMLVGLELSVKAAYLRETSPTSEALMESIKAHCLQRHPMVAPTTAVKMWGEFQQLMTPTAWQSHCNRLLDPASCSIVTADKAGEALRPLIAKALADADAVPLEKLIERFEGVHGGSEADSMLIPSSSLPESPVRVDLADDSDSEDAATEEPTSLSFVTPCGMVVEVESTLKDEGPGGDVEVSMVAHGLALAELFLSFQPERFLAAQLAPTLGFAVGVAGSQSAQALSQWFRRHMIQIDTMAVTMTERRIDLTAALGHEEALLSFIHNLFTLHVPWKEPVVHAALDHIARMSDLMNNAPLGKFESKVMEVNTCHHPFWVQPRQCDYARVDLDFAEKYFKYGFLNAPEYKISITGPFENLKAIRDLAARYLCDITVLDVQADLSAQQAAAAAAAAAAIESTTEAPSKSTGESAATAAAAGAAVDVALGGAVATQLNAAITNAAGTTSSIETGDGAEEDGEPSEGVRLARTVLTRRSKMAASVRREHSKRSTPGPNTAANESESAGLKRAYTLGEASATPIFANLDTKDPMSRTATAPAGSLRRHASGAPLPPSAFMSEEVKPDSSSSDSIKASPTKETTAAARLAETGAKKTEKDDENDIGEDGDDEGEEDDEEEDDDLEDDEEEAESVLVSAMRRLAWQVSFPSDIVEEVVYLSTDSRCDVCITFPLPALIDAIDILSAQTLLPIVENRLFEILRLRMNGVYTIELNSVYHIHRQLPGLLQIRFTCAPAFVDQLVRATLHALAWLLFEGPSVSDRDFVIAALRADPLCESQEDNDALAEKIDMQLLSDKSAFRRLCSHFFPLHRFTVVVLAPTFMEVDPPHTIPSLELFRHIRERVVSMQSDASLEAFEALARDALSGSGLTGAPQSTQTVAELEAELAKVRARALQLEAQLGALGSTAGSVAPPTPAGSSVTPASGAVSTTSGASAANPALVAAMAHRGWLAKRGEGSLQIRRRRYFVFEGPELAYYEDLKNGEPIHRKGAIVLTSDTRVDVNKKLLLVRTGTSDRVWNMEADSNETAVRWQQAIKTVASSIKA